MKVHYYNDCPSLNDDEDEIAFDAHEVDCEDCKAQGL